MIPLIRDEFSSYCSVQPVFCPLLGTDVPVHVETDGAEVHPD